MSSIDIHTNKVQESANEKVQTKESGFSIDKSKERHSKLNNFINNISKQLNLDSSFVKHFQDNLNNSINNYKLNGLTSKERLLKAGIDAFKKSDKFDPKEIDKFSTNLINILNSIFVDLSRENLNLQEVLEILSHKDSLDKIAEEVINMQPDVINRLFSSWGIKPAEGTNSSHFLKQHSV